MNNSAVVELNCESCEDWEKDSCCIGLLHNCKVVVKPVVYDHIHPVIIVIPTKEHCPIWKLSKEATLDIHQAVAAVADAFVKKNQFPNFFTGGNINNAKYGLQGVHAHVHVEPRVKEDPEYNTFPGHRNKRTLSEEEILKLKQEWKALLNVQ